ncbi:hypothetical protein B6U99_07515 [Candidatus Geothermarchaeota archaeon ex4572_27]|nr:MAG: hypothetical protein B6U99_07515 [Candidatus Geothermarchaeota archaeon ex4572_27]
MSEPIAAPRNAPLELKLRIMLRNWSYPEFREILYKEAKEGKDHRYFSVYKRLYAYLRASELRKQGLSYNEVAEAMRREVGFRPSKNMLSYWLRGIYTPLGNLSVFDVHQPEVGLVMGLILSDGSEYQYYHRCTAHAIGELINSDEGLLEMFRGACRKLGLSVYTRLKHKCWRAQTSSTLLYLLLKRFDEFIIKAPADVQWTFIRGLWLGDGHVGMKVVLINTDLSSGATWPTPSALGGCGPHSRIRGD